MLKVHMHDGTVHNIPLEDRTAAGLAEQLALLFARGGHILAMRVDDALPVEDKGKRPRKQKATTE